MHRNFSRADLKSSISPKSFVTYLDRSLHEASYGFAKMSARAWIINKNSPVSIKNAMSQKTFVQKNKTQRKTMQLKYEIK